MNSKKGENKRKENLYLLKQIIGVWYNLECFNIYNAIKIQSAKDEKFFVCLEKRKGKLKIKRKKEKQTKKNFQQLTRK